MIAVSKAAVADWAALLAPAWVVLGVVVGKLSDRRAEAAGWRRDRLAAVSSEALQQLHAVWEALVAVADDGSDDPSDRFDDGMREIRKLYRWKSEITVVGPASLAEQLGNLAEMLTEILGALRSMDRPVANIRENVGREADDATGDFERSIRSALTKGRSSERG